MSIFDRFKRTTSVALRRHSTQEIFFVLGTDEHGAYIRTTDNQGVSLHADYQNFSGAVRAALKELAQIAERDAFVIRWNTPTDRIYLNNNDHCLAALRTTDRLRDEFSNPISFAQRRSKAHIILSPEFTFHQSEKITEFSAQERNNFINTFSTNNVEEHSSNSTTNIPQEEIELQRSPSNNTTSEHQRDRIHARLIFRDENGQEITDFEPITERHILCNSILVETPPLGENFRLVREFTNSFPFSRLELYLSLAFSAIEDLHVEFEHELFGWKVLFSQDRNAIPCLIFERVDSDGSLYLRVTESIEGAPPGMFEEYDLRAVCSTNDIDKVVNIARVTTHSTSDIADEVEDHLQTLKTKFSLRDSYYREGSLFIVGKQLARDFIIRELPHLMQKFTIFGAEKLAQFNIRSVSPKLSLSLTHGIDFLEGTANVTVGNETFSLFEFLMQYRKRSYIQLSDGSSAIISAQFIERLERLFRRKEPGSSVARLSFFDLPLVEDIIDEKIYTENFLRPRQVYEGFAQLNERQVDVSSIHATLRPYQIQGLQWLTYLHEFKLGGCLADDMGLGKTLQTISLLSTIYPQEKLPTLVVMPKSLLYNWANEIQKFNPAITAAMYHGSNRNLQFALGHNVILTTYATVRNDIDELRKVSFYYIILDESQNIKNIDSQTSKAMMMLSGRHRLALSGTPIENNLGELYALFRFLNPAMFGSSDDFQRYYAVPIQRTGDKEATRDLRRKIYPFILRRLKKEVVTELPDKVEQVLYVDMSPEQHALYEERRQLYYNAVRSHVSTKGIAQSQFYVLQAINELRQIATIPEAMTEGAIVSPKREIIVGNIIDAQSNGHKSLVFCNFIKTVEMLRDDLQAEGISVLTITGATNNRQEIVDKFQNDKSVSVLIMTLKTGGLGLNLTAAEYIFIADPWWNQSAENQAIDRAHRIGQKNTVFSYKIISRNSIEEKILSLQRIKSSLFESVIGADSASLKSLSNDDIEYLLGTAEVGSFREVSNHEKIQEFTKKDTGYISLEDTEDVGNEFLNENQIVSAFEEEEEEIPSSRKVQRRTKNTSSKPAARTKKK